MDYTSPHPDDYPYIEPAAHWRKISFTLRTEDAVECEFWLIRPLPWLDQHGATVGAPMHIELEELGLVGNALVESIESIGAIARPESGGRNITGKPRRTERTNSNTTPDDIREADRRLRDGELRRRRGGRGDEEGR